MAVKEITARVKMQLSAGEASPAAPVGTSLGPHGVNLMEFVRAYNSATEDKRGSIIPVEITIYKDRTFTFVTKTPPAASLLRQAARVEKGSGEPHMTKVGTVTYEQVREIAKIKMPDLNANDEEAAMRIVAGTARSMGIEVSG
jgi:large subunit ribosomal protein L11